jgi:hypothetical protein
MIEKKKPQKKVIELLLLCFDIGDSISQLKSEHCINGVMY